ncbi:hypothetical protein ACFL3B_04980, partial [Gemmatimonadota bacterium]
MSRVRRRRFSLLASAALAFALLLVSCLDDSSGPEYQTGYLALAPSFRSDLIGLVDLDRIGVVITRTLDESVALDTVVRIASDADSMVLELPVFVSYLGETVSLTLYFITPSNDTAFVGGPVLAIVTAKFDRAPTPKEIEVVYVGVGSDAAAVRITTTEAFLFTGDTTTLTAEAVDSQGTVIEGTPIGWVSVDTTVARVP